MKSDVLKYTCVTSFSYVKGQAGRVRIDPRSIKGKDRRARVLVRFKKAFPKRPHVITLLSAIDNDRRFNLRISAMAESVSKFGFVAILRVWDDTHVIFADISWIACP